MREMCKLRHEKYENEYYCTGRTLAAGYHTNESNDENCFGTVVCVGNCFAYAVSAAFSGGAGKLMDIFAPQIVKPVSGRLGVRDPADLAGIFKAIHFVFHFIAPLSFTVS